MLFIEGLIYSKKMLTTQCTAFKKQLTIYSHYVNQSGFSVDARGVVVADPRALNSYYAAHVGSIQCANAPLTFYKEIESLFGGMHLPLKFSIRFLLNLTSSLSNQMTLRLVPTHLHLSPLLALSAP